MTTAAVRYRDVLRVREMRAVLVAHGISLTGTVAAEVALSVLVYQRTSSPLLTALTLGAGFVPQALSAVLLSGLADRVPPRRLLVTCDLLSAVVVSLMLLPDAPTPVLLVLAAVVGAVTPLFGGARSATLADLLDGPVWVLARSLLRVLSQSSLLLGFAVGGAAVALVGPRALLAADAVSFIGSALLLRLGTRARPARSASGGQSLRGAALDGVQVLRGAFASRPLRRLLLVTLLPSACFSTVDGLATPYSTQEHGGAQGIGLLLAAAALGSILAEPFGARLRLDVRRRLLLPVASLTGLALVGYATHPPVPVAALLDLLAGLGLAIGQERDGRLLALVPEQLRGRLLALQNGLLMAVQGVAITAAGAAAEVVPPQLTLAGAGVLDLLVVGALLRAGEPDVEQGAERVAGEADPNRSGSRTI